MKKIYKLSLLLGLLVTNTAFVYSYQEESIGKEIIAELEEQKKMDLIQKNIDTELYELFQRFFDEHDTMPFSKFITKVIAILKVKKNILRGQDLANCEELIKMFEKNKYQTGFHIWAPILITPNLRALMSPETRNYINSVSTQTKISSLITKLKK